MIFSSGQKRGILLLITLLSVIAGGKWLYQKSTEKSLPDLPDAQVKVYTKKKRWSSTEKRKYPPRSYPVIDLNQADSTQFEKLPGLGPVLSQRIIKYRTTIGVFDSIAQLKSVYNLPEETFERIKPWIRVDTTLAIFREYQRKKVSDSIRRDSIKQMALEIMAKSMAEEETYALQPKDQIELNTADSADLVQLYGIGSKLAARIPKYRKKLGFFHSTNQLSEVTGMYPENLTKVLQQVKVDSKLSLFPHVRINHFTKEELANHPYIDWKMAKQIVAYRDQHGPFKGKSALSKMYGIKPEAWERLAPYLVFD